MQNKRDVPIPPPATPIETFIERENKKEDEANVEEIESTSKDYWGRSAQQTDGAVPSAPPEHDPLKKKDLRKPQRPPKHNI